MGSRGRIPLIRTFITRRACVILLLLIVGGAIVNVAVAWGCSWWGSPQYLKTEPTRVIAFWSRPEICPRLTNSELPVVISRGFGFVEGCAVMTVPINKPSNWDPAEYSELLEHNFEMGIANYGDCREFLEGLMDVSDYPVNEARYIALRTDAGWPLQSVRGWGPATPSAYQKAIADGVDWPRKSDAFVILRRMPGAPSGKVVRVLPLRPIWPGFAINTLFYAVILWVLFAAPFALRRRIRIRRGLCPACAYPVGASDVCTECGKAVTPVPRACVVLSSDGRSPK